MNSAKLPYKISHWFNGSQSRPTALMLQTKTDVAVVGGGFAGLSSALHLKQTQPDLKVTVLEANHLGFGASGRSGGWFVSFPPLYWLIDDLNNGRKAAEFRFATEFCQRHMDDVVRSSEMLEVSKSKHYLVARNFFERATLRWMSKQLDKIGFANEYFEGPRTHNIVGYPALAVMAWETYMIQPYSLILELKKRCELAGVEIFEHTRVQNFFSTDEGVHMQLAYGAELIANKMILATNAYTSKLNLGEYSKLGSVQHTYMLATEKLESDTIRRISRDRVAFGDPSLFYYCGRWHEDRLLFNGCDRNSEATTADDQYLPAYERLHAEMIRRFPFLKDTKIESAWGGPTLQTSTEAPIVCSLKNHPGVILNVGYGGGSGISMALQSGALTTDIVLGKTRPDSESQRLIQVFDNSRFPIMGPFRAVFGVLGNF